ncbi:tRNA uridine-5-carboxymethylaminomethyl(34) synthesis GTPase MnmE [Candidatus Blochmanniella camponoti]|uniref:tRNA modification GTPase MnmE n=1 Tax=Candidatus Blochmanniella camponoti TaxID=108080 RepID=A0ABY4SRF9_9ENTR|nr:tRNA uridine-5-carboxymethylaminomethyl(34) synthesis GTPase MnmE [Candidatus Blochmannia herculeanus]URJ24461.1 tRNA uridine-5-carboxymethylaminomethyl(34) synthesis GTPase MnmE [Candidatus Blochmannia herculeanus]URJ26931.1 tRNA uridine-5-carboxymethylaminomethyl(34) synthesis GTPase MnmE [Candidatus Blochmannia herculeanus]
MSYTIDTVVAISTPPGRGGIGVIRISGKSVPAIAPKLLGKMPNPRKAEYLPFLDTDGSILEQVIALFFPEPNSFTGENILEIHGHGGQIILDILLERILKTSSDIRIAHPGEFTKRAFLNNKIDLIQAEAIADIIDATSYQAAKSASNSLQGIFSRKIHIISEQLANLRMYAESSIDFSEDEISIIPYEDIKKKLRNIINDVQNMYKSTYHGVLLREGIKIVIAGKPNAGKSSLFNALVGIDRAIISTISGTTRDTLHEYIQLNGIAFHITDTAGLQKKSDNEIEQIGMKRTWEELNNADHILWVIDPNDETDQEHDITLEYVEKVLFCKNKKTPITIIHNKSDLTKNQIGISIINNYTIITLSALLYDGTDLLKEYLSNNIKFQIQKDCSYNLAENQGNFIARRRHLDALEKSSKYLLSAQTQLLSAMSINELFAEDLGLAHKELSKIFGKFTPDDLLTRIFSTFCIGK